MFIHYDVLTVCQDFVPEILPTKSRTETATLQRRKQMQKEIEQHERERLETARPGEDERMHSPSPLIAEPPDSLQGVTFRISQGMHGLGIHHKYMYYRAPL